ncbi:S66 family peptidase [Haladaptatus salinisoli]|uniref:S66 family peptidase n=1 Tax=Haladaptatus salinisoli TaxID=2884876 RepID=UPI001D0A33DB|nr:S66 peptidase family protein [Haladaptatus salinisoli]
MPDCEYPPPVTAGDTVAVVAPSHAPPDGFEQGLRRLRSFGVRPKVYETATRSTDWLRDNPEARAADVMAAFRDEEVDAVVAAMGGNRELQILDHLDEEVVRRNPKRFFGSSDNTHLHLFLNRAGLVSFYGGQLFPDLTADPAIHPYTRANVSRALSATPFGVVRPASHWTDEYYDFDERTTRTWFPADDWHWHGADGRVVAPVVGGCLSMLRTQLLAGSPRFGGDALSGSVLAVETSGETPGASEVERFFMALGERGVLDDLEGVLVGKPETPGGDRAARDRYRREQRKAIAGTVDEYADVPCVFDLDFGHPAPVLPLPIGAEVEIDGSSRTIRFR